MSDAINNAVQELEVSVLRISAAMPAPLERNAAADLRTAVFLQRSGDSESACFYLARWLGEDHIQGEAELALAHTGFATQLQAIYRAYEAAREKAAALFVLLGGEAEATEDKDARIAELEVEIERLNMKAGFACIEPADDCECAGCMMLDAHIAAGGEPL